MHEYYGFRDETMELIAEASAEFEELLPKADRVASLDARLIIDSFNE